jgi:hypothetical protein
VTAVPELRVGRALPADVARLLEGPARGLLPVRAVGVLPEQVRTLTTAARRPTRGIGHPLRLRRDMVGTVVGDVVTALLTWSAPRQEQDDLRS